MNSVNSLLTEPFSRRSLEQKIEIKKLGRPTPDLNIVQVGKKSKDRTYTRHFNKKLYEEHSWICGCDLRNALFCFPCLLFGGHDAWSKTGVRDLGHIMEYIRKHAENKNHLNNVLDYSVFGNTNIAVQLSQAYHDSIQKHNNQVEKNRYILSKVIDCIKFCGIFELALRGHDESDQSENSGIFLGLIDLVSGIDSAVKEHLKNSIVSKYTSKLIQNELLECILEVCQDIIKEELIKAKYVAVIADETTDIANQLQLAIVFRYELNGIIHERFWGFFQPSGQNADDISECILKELNAFFSKEPNKVIAQSFDGASVMSGSVNGVQAKIKEHFPNAHFVHCYAHQLNLIMEKAASQNQSARVFFCSLSAFPAFFAGSPQRLSALEDVCGRHIPTAPSTRWNFKSRTVNVVYENKDALIECCKKLEISHSRNTVQEARGLRFNLEYRDFTFWLEFFKKVMPHVDIFYRQLQSRQIDAIKVNNAIHMFVTEMSRIRDGIDLLSTEDEEFQEKKRRRMDVHRVADAKEVCDRITMEVRSRFQISSHLDAAKLLDSSNFLDYSIHFPEATLRLTVEKFPVLNKNRLRTELAVLYEREDFRNISGAVTLLQLMNKNNLEEAFHEVATLLRIIGTIPMTTSEAERCFSSLKRIKTFLRNTMSQDRLTALAMLSIEKSIVRNTGDFNARVIDKFSSKKNRRMEFNFRH